MCQVKMIIPGTATHTNLLWERLTHSAPWTGRSDMCAVVVGGRIVLTGGHRNNNYTHDVWSSQDGVEWDMDLGAAPWDQRSYHSCTTLPGDRMLIVGGHANGAWYNDVWVSGMNGNVSHWERQTPNAGFNPRAAGSLSYQESTGKLFYFGGSNGLLPPFGAGKTKLFNDVWMSADEGKTWSMVTKNAGWAPREGLSGGHGFVVGNQEELVVIGGESGYFITDFFSDVWTSLNGANWTERQTKAEWTNGGWNKKGRSGHIVVKQTTSGKGDTLWLAGGYLGKHDVWCVGGIYSGSDLTKGWLNIGNAPWKGRYDHVLIIHNSKLFMFGGENSALGFGGPYYNDVWAADVPGVCH